MTKILFAGLGSIGKRHMRNLAKLGVTDFHAWRTRGLPLDDDLELTATYTTLEAGLAAKPDAVFVCNPSSAHLETAQAAARAGCHLFIEKPLSHNMDNVGELVRLVNERSLATMMGFNLRYHPGVQAVKKLLDEQAIGRVTSVRVQVGQWLPDWHPDEDYRQNYSARRDLGGGVILDLIHELDYAYWLMGPIQRVACFAGKLSSLDIDTEDTAEIILESEAGAIGSVHVDYVQRAPTRTCVVIGEEGSIELDLIAADLRVWRTDTGDWDETRFEFDRNDMYLDEVAHFLDCIASGQPCRNDVSEGQDVMRLAAAAAESARSGRAIAP